MSELKTTNNKLPITERLLLTPNEACSLCGVSRETLNNMIEDSNDSFILHVGTHRKIKRKKFEEYIERLDYI